MRQAIPLQFIWMCNRKKISFNKQAICLLQVYKISRIESKFCPEQTILSVSASAYKQLFLYVLKGWDNHINWKAMSWVGDKCSLFTEPSNNCEILSLSLTNNCRTQPRSFISSVSLLFASISYKISQEAQSQHILTTHQSVTYWYREFLLPGIFIFLLVSEQVSKKFCTKKSLATGIWKKSWNWYQKNVVQEKVLLSVSKIFGPGKSIGISIVQNFETSFLPWLTLPSPPLAAQNSPTKICASSQVNNKVLNTPW